MVTVVVLWGVTAILTVFTAVRLTGIERGSPLVQLMAFTPYVAPAALVCAAVAGIAGATGPWVMCLLIWAALTATVAPRLFAAKAASGGARLRVLTANILYDRGDMTALVERAKIDDVDVLAVQELTAQALKALDAAGIETLLPYRVALPAGRGNGSGLFSRHPLTPTNPSTADASAAGPARRHACGMLQAGATVHVPGAGPVLIESAHPCAPRPRQVTCWAQNLADQPHAGGTIPQILLGDFNATLDHAPLRRLLRTGYRDAAAVRGLGLAPTWPFRRWRRQRIVPWVTLDHVLADRRIGIGEVGTRTIPGSDHRGVLAELHIPTPR
ncbi:endonuclease/exonuclease/phosphatase family protein [Dactylosporangium sp. NPDC005555]|uniref:endonuclease/exonuclease/phosphatase family protein n=1 Tax=Dactylosporangium sp. NPDC005555 TaxID=3154889 RepID=UPI0033A93FFC